MSELVPMRELPLVGLPPIHEHRTSIDRSTPAGQLLAYRAATSRDASLDELVGQVVEVANYYAHWVEDRTEGALPGAYRRRIVLIGSDGALVSTSSETAWRCVVAAAAISEAQPPFAPALRFRVHHRPRKPLPGHFIYLEWLLAKSAAEGNGHAPTKP